MGPIVEGLQRSTLWRGRSGRVYALATDRLADFALCGSELSLVARGNLVLWVGSLAEVVNDADSRARFRLALDCADRAFRMTAPSDAVDRATIIWDLEGAGPAVTAVNVAA